MYPNIESTRKFMDNIKSDIAKSNNNSYIFKMLPNKFTYYFLLLQGIRSNDVKFVNETLVDLSNSKIELSDELNNLMNNLKRNGYTVPESMIQ